MPVSKNTKVCIGVGISSFLLGLILALILLFRGCGTNEPEKKEVHDTIFRTDTLIQEKTVLKYITHHDTVLYQEYIFGEDTVHDTVHVDIPIEHKEYKDTLRSDSSEITLQINYSGYRAKIDTLLVTNHYYIEPNVVTKKTGWGPYVGIGVHVGYGATIVQQKVLAGPEVGVSVQLGFGYKFK